MVSESVSAYSRQTDSLKKRRRLHLTSVQLTAATRMCRPRRSSPIRASRNYSPCQRTQKKRTVHTLQKVNRPLDVSCCDNSARPVRPSMKSSRWPYRTYSFAVVGPLLRSGLYLECSGSGCNGRAGGLGDGSPQLGPGAEPRWGSGGEGPRSYRYTM